MGLAAVAATTKTFRSDAVEEMAPALTEPLSQSKLSSSAASGASPRTSSSTSTTATVSAAATLGGTTLLPSVDELLVVAEQLQEQQEHPSQPPAEQQQQQQQQGVVADQNNPAVVQFPLQTTTTTTTEPLAGAAAAASSTSTVAFLPPVVAGQEEQGEGHLAEMGMMSLPVTSGDGGSTTVDDIQNNNSTGVGGGGGQVLLKQLEQDVNRDLVEIALEQLHQDATAAIAGGDGGGAALPAIDTLASGVVDMAALTAVAAASSVPSVPPGSSSDFVLLDANSAPTPILPQPTFQDGQQQQQQQHPQHHQDLSQSSTSSSLGVGGVGGNELGGLMKESADMDQMIRELSTSDIDLLQVLKSFDNNSLLLFSDVDVANLCDVGPVDGRGDAHHTHHHPSAISSPTASPSKDHNRERTTELHAEIAKRQAQMQRKYDFLVRRLNKVIARYMGQHVSEEVAGLFEHTQRYWKKREKEHAKQQLHHNNNNNNNNNSSSNGGGGGNVAPAAVSGAAAAGEKWPEIIPFQAPPPDATPTPPEKLKPISANALKTFTKRMEGISTTICSVQSKSVLRSRHFSSGLGSKPLAGTTPGLADKAATALAESGNSSSSGSISAHGNISNTIPLFDRVATQELEQTAGLLHAELRHVQASLDSDATLSSSGGDSADESMPYVNAQQEPLTITERASWKWSKDRAAVASRWTWLVARIADLEYRIRQHSEVLNKIRAKKGAVTLEELPASSSSPSEQPPQSLNGYRGQLPGSSSKPLDAATTIIPAGTKDDEDEAAAAAAADAMSSCSRARPYCRSRFRKRKLLQTHNLHIISKRAARPSNFKCGCQWPLHPCALCTGRQDPTAPRDPPDTMPFADRVALLDSCYHSVLSFPEDIPHSVHLEAIMRLPEWQNKMLRSTPIAIATAATAAGSTHNKSTTGGAARGAASSSIFSSGDETGPSSLGKRYTGSDGKRKLISSSSSNKYKSDRSFTDSGNKFKRAKSRRDVILQNSNRKSGYGGSAAADGGGRMSGPNGGHHRNHRNNKSRKSSHCYDYYDDGGVSRSKNSSPTPTQRNERRPRNSYDIDNIVIPYSMAATTRVSLPQYKDIAIPKWRIVDETDESNATASSSTLSVEEGAAAVKLLDSSSTSTSADTSQCSTTASASLSEQQLVPATSTTSTSTTTPTSANSDDKQQQQQASSNTTVINKKKVVTTGASEPLIPPNGTKTAPLKAAAGTQGENLPPPPPPPLLPPPPLQAPHHQQQQQQQQQLFVMPAQDEEDISEEAIMLKHERALQEERKKFRSYMKFPWSRPRANRRTESRAGSSGGNTPDPTSPAPPTPMVEHDSSPACPSTPLTPQDGQELSEANVINALNKSLTKKERRRTVSSKRDEQHQTAAGAGGGGSTTPPDTREVVSPYESLQFPLADDIFEEMVRSMPDDHIALVEDCISKLTGRRSRHRNNNVLLVLKSSSMLAPTSLGLGLAARRNPLSSSASCSSTTLSATETDLEEFDDEDLMLAKRTETQQIMERLLSSSRDGLRQYEIVPPTAKPMLGDDEDDGGGLIDDEETDTGESLFVEEDDPNDPEWNDRPSGGGGGGGGGGAIGRI